MCVSGGSSTVRNGKGDDDDDDKWESWGKRGMGNIFLLWGFGRCCCAGSFLVVDALGCGRVFGGVVGP